MSINSRSDAERSLYVDNYQLTMAQLYFRLGIHERPALFEHFTRANPDYGTHQAGYCISAGMDWLIEWIESASFLDRDIEALASQRTSDGRPLFDSDFLDWLSENGNYSGITIRAIPEGRVVHANVPLAIVSGPLAMAQILETSLLNHLNFQTLIATKASRVSEAAHDRPVLEFGLRRSPEHAASAATRASLIGGAHFSSNTGISHLLGVEPKGTHAHAMVQVAMALGMGEKGAFAAYANQYPDDCLLLVDTINTLESGIPNAIEVFEDLRGRGHEPVGIRLDSGDLAYLSVQSAVLLNEAGYPDVAIVLSSGLDELLILQILTQIRQEAPRYGIDPDQLIGRLSFGVGSKLTTSGGQPYLDGVYKMVAIENEGVWEPAIKVSDSTAKAQNPGDKDVVRIYDQRGNATADLIGIAGEDLTAGPFELRHHSQYGVRRTMEASEVSHVEPLLETVYADGSRVSPSEDLETIRARRDADLARLDRGVRRLVNPHRYHVSLTPELWALKQKLIKQARDGVLG